MSAIACGLNWHSSTKNNKTAHNMTRNSCFAPCLIFPKYLRGSSPPLPHSKFSCATWLNIHFDIKLKYFHFTTFYIAGTDSRIGFGYRFGDHADFQVQFEIGPQKETQPIGTASPSKRNIRPANEFQIERAVRKEKVTTHVRTFILINFHPAFCFFGVYEGNLNWKENNRKFSKNFLTWIFLFFLFSSLGSNPKIFC